MLNALQYACLYTHCYSVGQVWRRFTKAMLLFLQRPSQRSIRAFLSAYIHTTKRYTTANSSCEDATPTMHHGLVSALV